MSRLKSSLIAPFIVGAILMTFLLGCYAYLAAVRAAEDSVADISKAKATQAASLITLFFRTMSASLQHMSADRHLEAFFSDEDKRLALKLDRDDVQSWLTALAQGNEYIRDIFIVDAGKSCIMSTNPAKLGQSYAGEAYIENALDGIAVLHEPSIGRLTRRLRATFAGPIDINGSVVGVFVIVASSPPVFSDIMGSGGELITTSILDANGLFVRHDKLELIGDKERALPDLYKSLSFAGMDGKKVTYDLFGEEYEGYARLEPVTKWIVAASGSRMALYESASRAGYTVFGIALGGLVVLLLFVMRKVDGILSALFVLINFAKTISEGHLEQKLGNTQRNDELGTLHHALQRLVQSLGDMLVASRQASEAKGYFLANMSHEIRTPLNAIIGMLHLALDDASLSPALEERLRKINMASRTLLGLLNDILDLSKVEAGQLVLENAVFDLKLTLRDIAAIYQQMAADKGLSLSCEYREDTPSVFIGDQTRIGQIVNNLVGNALKFTKEGGVVISCHAEKAEPDESGFVVMHVAVKDSGIGMDKETVNKLFQPFTQADATTSRQFGGSGLGLAICLKIVEMFGGSFTVRSEPGKGSVFDFSLRLQPSSEAAPAGAATEVDFKSLDLTGKTILIAEDNEINRLIMEELLEPTGAHILAAENGEEAVRVLREHRADIVLMDMQMPIMGGLEATKAIRAFLSAEELPIIAVTANAMAEEKNEGYSAGMNGYITKPVELTELYRVLQKLSVS